MLIKQPDSREERERVRWMVTDRSDTTATVPTFKHIYITSTSFPLSLLFLPILPPNQSKIFLSLPAKLVWCRDENFLALHLDHLGRRLVAPPPHTKG